jgi:hypothetical protein
MLTHRQVLAGSVFALTLAVSACAAEKASLTAAPVTQQEPAQAQITAPPDTAPQCLDRGLALVRGARVRGIIGSFQATAAEVAAWQLVRHGPTGPSGVSQPVAMRPPSEILTLCYYEGDFGPGRGLFGPGYPTPRPYTRMLVIVSEQGNAWMDGVGPDTMPVSGP